MSLITLSAFTSLPFALTRQVSYVNMMRQVSYTTYRHLSSYITYGHLLRQTPVLSDRKRRPLRDANFRLNEPRPHPACAAHKSPELLYQVVKVALGLGRTRGYEKRTDGLPESLGVLGFRD